MMLTIFSYILCYSIILLLSMFHPHRHFACCVGYLPQSAHVCRKCCTYCALRRERAREGERESNTPRSTQTDHYEVHLPRHRLHYPFQSPSSRKLGRSVCTAVWAKSFRPALGDSLGSLGRLVACLPLFVAYI